MRHALILAGGSGTRLWPMSRAKQPKQLIPFIAGKSLLQIAVDRLEGLVPSDNQYICASNNHREAILSSLPGFSEQRFLGEPTGRDTLNAVGYAAAVIARRDPDAVIAVFTADHLIEPVAQFQRIVQSGFELSEAAPNTLVTFGITPNGPATGYGYLELGEPLQGGGFTVRQFREKPDAATAQTFFEAGAERYLWNSGMFVWRADTLLDCIRRYTQDNYQPICDIAQAWGGADFEPTLQRIYPTLRKISVDFAVMEPASRDPKVRVAAVPMNLTWLDVGSWPMFAKTCPQDDNGNAIGAGRQLLLDSRNTVVASSQPEHLIAAVGCEDLIIIHTPDATLVCRADQAEAIKELHKRVGEQFGKELL